MYEILRKFLEIRNIPKKKFFFQNFRNSGKIPVFPKKN
jgi:hypothetical protein